MLIEIPEDIIFSAVRKALDRHPTMRPAVVEAEVKRGRPAKAATKAKPGRPAKYTDAERKAKAAAYQKARREKLKAEAPV